MQAHLLRFISLSNLCLILLFLFSLIGAKIYRKGLSPLVPTNLSWLNTCLLFWIEYITQGSVYKITFFLFDWTLNLHFSQNYRIWGPKPYLCPLKQSCIFPFRVLGASLLFCSTTLCCSGWLYSLIISVERLRVQEFILFRSNNHSIYLHFQANFKI